MCIGKIKLFIVLVLLQMSASVWGGWAIEDVVVVALSPLDKSAVVRLPNRSLQVLKQGDGIHGTDLILTLVLTNKLVLQGRPSLSSSNGAGRIVWLHRAVGGISKVEYADTQK
jgi:hypothetical protein